MVDAYLEELFSFVDQIRLPSRQCTRSESPNIAHLRCKLILNIPFPFPVLCSSPMGRPLVFLFCGRVFITSQVGCMSSSFWWNNQDFNGTILSRANMPKPSALEVYLDSGNSGAGPFCTKADGDDCVETVAVRDHITALGWTLGDNLFYYLDVGGQHSEAYWGRRFHLPMLAMYGIADTIMHPSSGPAGMRIL